MGDAWHQCPERQEPPPQSILDFISKTEPRLVASVAAA